ncbi:MAG: family 10 glycosylhydrolase [Bacteroides sp.]|nr:family 10 glycosylhydrolase [Bacteroides sp.]
MRRYWFLAAALAILFIPAFFSCEKDPDPDPDPNGEDTVQLRILSFNFEDFNPVIVGQIDHTAKEISAQIPRSGSLNNLKPTVTFTEGATLNPPSGYPYDFSQPLGFTVKKDNKQVTYIVHVGYEASTENELISVSFPELFRTGSVSGQSISLEVPFGTDLSEILVEFSISPFATVEPESGSRVNLGEPLTITVKSEAGQQNVFTLTTTVLPQETGIRAFWIAPPWHSTFLTSYQHIKNGVALAKELNFNTLYVGAWAQTKTLYPSQVLLDHSSYTSIEQTLFSSYTGGSGDPLADLIEEAHAEGLKVILWYEYGFMAKWGTPPTPENDPILSVHPDWVGINSFGSQSNYNNSDYYYNAYNVAVQQFMIDLVLEAVENYDIDGIQGDDRMPAMPRNSGYDEYTVNRYRTEHGGTDPPANFNNSAWVRWRADILNQFAIDLFDAVKEAKPNIFVASSPNPYPWAFDNLMQEWPVWLDDGVVEILSVQCYRYTESAYLSTINEVLNYFTSHGDGNLQRLVPGIILQSSAGLTDAELIAKKIMINRSKGITGEAFFYDAPLGDERIKKVIRAFYPGPAIFPDFQ